MGQPKSILWNSFKFTRVTIERINFAKSITTTCPYKSTFLVVLLAVIAFSTTLVVHSSKRCTNFVNLFMTRFYLDALLRLFWSPSANVRIVRASLCVILVICLINIPERLRNGLALSWRVIASPLRMVAATLFWVVSYEVLGGSG